MVTAGVADIKESSFCELATVTAVAKVHDTENKRTLSLGVSAAHGYLARAMSRSFADSQY